jgi:LytS/YehU family sensor histidine kinase
MFIILSVLYELWKSHTSMSLGLHPPMSGRYFRYFGLFQGMVGFVFINGLAVAVRSTSMWFYSKNQVQALELEKIRNELSFLKMQISPHFLFNTLNNILTLIDENSELAKKSILQLSNLLRSVLYDSEADSVTIKQETEFLTNYSNLMRLRYGSELNFNLEADLNEPDAPIAPLLLISFLENIFKHGIGASVKDSFIDIKISSSKGKIIFESSNTYFPKNNQDRSGSGIGTDNIQKRLALLYEGRYFYDCKITDGKYITKLELRL